MFVGNKFPAVVDAMGFASVLTLFIPFGLIFAASESVRELIERKVRRRETRKKAEEDNRGNK